MELAALSLAVLSLLHELNKTDKWFGLGLVLVSVFFITAAFGGFSLALMWQPACGLPQVITLVFVIALGAAALLAIDSTSTLRPRWRAPFAVSPVAICAELHKRLDSTPRLNRYIPAAQWTPCILSVLLSERNNAYGLSILTDAPKPAY
jgi:hypothetical protein